MVELLAHSIYRGWVPYTSLQ